MSGEGGGGARPPPFITVIITSKVAVYAPAEWADTVTPVSSLVKICTLWSVVQCVGDPDPQDPHVFLGLQDPDPSDRGTDQAPDPFPFLK